MLDELRRKPRAVRQFYAFWSAAGITGLIATVWMISIIVKVSDTTPNGQDNTAGAFSQFFEEIDGGAISTLKDKLKKQEPTDSVSTTESAATTSTANTSPIGPKRPVQISTSTSQSVTSGAGNQAAE